jgi:hypothetical protein
MQSTAAPQSRVADPDPPDPHVFGPPGSLNLFFVGILKVNDENRRIRIRIRIHHSEAWIRGSGSTQKCHGSATLPRREKRPGDNFRKVIMLDKTALIYEEGRKVPLKNHFAFIVLETFLSGRGLFDPYGKQSNEKMVLRNTNFTTILIFHPLVSTVPFGV